MKLLKITRGFGDHCGISLCAALMTGPIATKYFENFYLLMYPRFIKPVIDIIEYDLTIEMYWWYKVYLWFLNAKS